MKLRDEFNYLDCFLWCYLFPSIYAANSRTAMNPITTILETKAPQLNLPLVNLLWLKVGWFFANDSSNVVEFVKELTEIALKSTDNYFSVISCKSALNSFSSSVSSLDYGEASPKNSVIDSLGEGGGGVVVLVTSSFFTNYSGS